MAFGGVTARRYWKINEDTGRRLVDQGRMRVRRAILCHGTFMDQKKAGKFIDRLVGHGRRDERRPDWTRGDRIRANALSARICASPAVKFWIAPLVGLLEQSTTARIYPYGSPGDLNESDF